MDPVSVVAIEFINHNTSVIVDDVAWVEAHGWCFIYRSDSDPRKLVERSLTLTLLDGVNLIDSDVGICEDGAPILLVG